jgi:hypothetical protein
MLTGILGACLPASPGSTPTGFPGLASQTPPATLPSSTPEAGPTTLPTPTIVWFPPTSTPTLFPTSEVTPTPEMRPNLGRTLLVDTFDNASAWKLNSAGDARVALSRNELTLAIAPTESKDYVLSLREEPVLGDFYVEITASTSLCRSGDEYGLLLRAASNQDYYRFALSCSSQARVDRILQSQTTSPQPWVLSGAVPPGAPGSARLAVWAVGKEMRFFVNEEYLFAVSDPSLPRGVLGVFARSVGANAVTVNFSNLVIREITTTSTSP